MGTTAAETLREIDAARDRLATDLAALERRLPQADELAEKAKTYGGAAAGAVGGLVVLVALAKRRSAKKEQQEIDARLRREARIQAQAIVAAFADQARQSVAAAAPPVPPTPHVDDDEDDGGFPTFAAVTALLAAIAGVIAYFQRQE